VVQLYRLSLYSDFVGSDPSLIEQTAVDDVVAVDLVAPVNPFAAFPVLGDGDHDFLRSFPGFSVPADGLLFLFSRALRQLLFLLLLVVFPSLLVSLLLLLLMPLLMSLAAPLTLPLFLLCLLHLSFGSLPPLIVVVQPVVFHPRRVQSYRPTKYVFP
jgi:hypothetical protein